MKKVPAFSLIEVVVSSALVATTVGALFAVGAMTTRVTTLGQDRLIASQLAREGIEVVRQIRDTNFVSDVQTTNCSQSLCGDWRGGILSSQSEVNDIVNGATKFTYRQIDVHPRLGFTLSPVNLSPENPCSDYIDRTDEQLEISHGSGANTNVFQKFCRRIVIEAVNDLDIPNSEVNEKAQTLRVRSQVAWLGNGRTSFRKDFSTPQCEENSTEWCTEQVTLLTNWRPAL